MRTYNDEPASPGFNHCVGTEDLLHRFRRQLQACENACRYCLGGRNFRLFVTFMSGITRAREQPNGRMGHKSQTPQKVTTGRFEIERDGHVAFLEYSMTGSALGLLQTEVPSKLRGLGLASSLAETALPVRAQRQSQGRCDLPFRAGLHRETPRILGSCSALTAHTSLKEV